MREIQPQPEMLPKAQRERERETDTHTLPSCLPPVSCLRLALAEPSLKLAGKGTWEMLVSGSTLQ